MVFIIGAEIGQLHRERVKKQKLTIREKQIQDDQK
jgi:hypothetical protein